MTVSYFSWIGIFFVLARTVPPMSIDWQRAQRYSEIGGHPAAAAVGQGLRSVSRLPASETAARGPLLTEHAWHTPTAKRTRAHWNHWPLSAKSTRGVLLISLPTYTATEQDQSLGAANSVGEHVLGGRDGMQGKRGCWQGVDSAVAYGISLHLDPNHHLHASRR